MNFDVQVHGRDAAAKAYYQFMRWLLRFHRREIGQMVDHAVAELAVKGHCAVRMRWEA